MSPAQATLGQRPGWIGSRRMVDIQADVRIYVEGAKDGITDRKFVLTPQKPSIAVGRSSPRAYGIRPGPQKSNAYFNNPVVSRQHATLTFDQDSGVLRITDAKSMHGTFVHDHRLEPNKPKDLSCGDIVTLGVDITSAEQPFNAQRLIIHYETSQVCQEAKAIETPRTPKSKATGQISKPKSSQPAAIVYRVPDSSSDESDLSDLEIGEDFALGLAMDDLNEEVLSQQEPVGERESLTGNAGDSPVFTDRHDSQKPNGINESNTRPKPPPGSPPPLKKDAIIVLEDSENSEREPSANQAIQNEPLAAAEAVIVLSDVEDEVFDPEIVSPTADKNDAGPADLRKLYRMAREKPRMSGCNTEDTSLFTHKSAETEDHDPLNGGSDEDKSDSEDEYISEADSEAYSDLDLDSDLEAVSPIPNPTVPHEQDIFANKTAEDFHPTARSSSDRTNSQPKEHETSPNSSSEPQSTFQTAVNEPTSSASNAERRRNTMPWLLDEENEKGASIRRPGAYMSDIMDVNDKYSSHATQTSSTNANLGPPLATIRPPWAGLYPPASEIPVTIKPPMEYSPAQPSVYHPFYPVNGMSQDAFDRSSRQPPPTGSVIPPPPPQFPAAYTNWSPRAEWNNLNGPGRPRQPYECLSAFNYFPSASSRISFADSPSHLNGCEGSAVPGKRPSPPASPVAERWPSPPPLRYCEDLSTMNEHERTTFIPPTAPARMSPLLTADPPVQPKLPPTDVAAEFPTPLSKVSIHNIVDLDPEYHPTVSIVAGKKRKFDEITASEDDEENQATRQEQAVDGVVELSSDAPAPQTAMSVPEDKEVANTAAYASRRSHKEIDQPAVENAAPEAPQLHVELTERVTATKVNTSTAERPTKKARVGSSMGKVLLGAVMGSIGTISALAFLPESIL